MNRLQQKYNAHMNAAKAYAGLSYARRLKVGAVIVREDRIISIGYNGTASGTDNNCEWLVHDESKIKRSLRTLTNDEINEEIASGWKLESKQEICHAEANAILFAAKNGISTYDTELIVTHSPCFECSKMIVQCGIKTVFYETPYRDLSPIEFLKNCNVFVKELN